MTSFPVQTDPERDKQLLREGFEYRWSSGHAEVIELEDSAGGGENQS